MLRLEKVFGFGLGPQNHSPGFQPCDPNNYCWDSLRIQKSGTNSVDCGGSLPYNCRKINNQPLNTTNLGPPTILQTYIFIRQRYFYF